MARYRHPLSSVKIASPCSADWENMIGNARRRFCGQCELNVFNLSDMTRREAEELINQTEGRLCVRFFKRDDGTILTRDCPVGLRAIRRRLSRVTTAVLSTILGFLSGLGLYGAVQETDRPTTMGVLAREVPVGAGGLSISEVKSSVGEMATFPHTIVSTYEKKRGKRIASRARFTGIRP